MVRVLWVYFCIFAVGDLWSVCCIRLRSASVLAAEKAMAPHSSTLAWKIPWTEEPGGLQSMGSLRVRHNWATSLSHFTFMHWRRKWQPTPVFLPGESQGWRSLVGFCLWGRRTRLKWLSSSSSSVLAEIALNVWTRPLPPISLAK